MILTRLAAGARDDVALAVDLANTWETLDPPNERLRDLGSLRRVLEHHGHDAAADAATDDDVVPVRGLRDRLRDAFAASDEQDAVASLNELLANAPAARLVRDGRSWRFGWDESTPDFLAPTTATALLDAIRRDGFERSGRAPARRARVSSSTGRETGAGVTAASSAPTALPRRRAAVGGARARALRASARRGGRHPRRGRPPLPPVRSGTATSRRAVARHSGSRHRRLRVPQRLDRRARHPYALR